MAVAGVEWLLLFFIVILLIIIIWRIENRKARRKIEDLSMRALAVIRSKGGKASIDDIIVLGGVPPSLISKIMGDLLKRGIVGIVEENGTVFYTLMQRPTK